MSKAENTKKYIVEKSAPIFNIKGYSGTSLSDIMDATGLTKGAIYGNFENKDEVAIAAYHHNLDELIGKLTAAMRDKKTASEKLIAFTEYYRTNWKTIFERGGCIIQNAAIEADDNAPYLKKHVQRSIKDWVNGFTRIIELGQQDGTFKKKIDAEAFAYEMIITLEGAIMLGKIMNNQQLLFKGLDKIVNLIHTELKA
ncbi:MAG TPA: TetR/AcrR family transcriptional regulator [Bacteroidia bacterium]|jgi:AcrR family transcriptional regulator|nr:TetR/AcrR family transcriptional regulator [Bacteroidia bacterium]HRG53138.1 TetR/AcrR family transcriptional regulator [Bacteroidia bacterium]